MGKGEIYFKKDRYLIDLTILKYPNYAAAMSDQPMWEKAFEVASQYLYTATRGQLQLGKILMDLNSSGGIHADAYVTLSPNNSNTATGFADRVPGSTKLGGPIRFSQLAMKHPLEIAHELAHAALGLCDEYTGYGINSIACCTGDASSGASIMEFSAAKHGKILKRHDNGTICVCGSVEQEVNEFCFPRTAADEDYEHMRGDDDSGNGNSKQTDYYSKYGYESCWEVMRKFFPKLKQPAKADAVPDDLLDIVWVPPPEVESQLYVVVLDTNELALRGFMKNLKPSILSFSRLVSATGDHFALGRDSDVIRKMGPISKDEAKSDKEQPGLVNDIFNLENATGTGAKLIRLGVGDFNEAASAAFRRLIVVLPGNGKLDPDSSTEWFDSLTELLREDFITLTVITIGPGELTTSLDELKLNSPRLEHRNVTVLPEEGLGGFRLQSVLTELYLSESPGVGLIAAKSGFLPKISVRDMQDNPLEYDKPVKALLLHPQAEGVDFPVFIEQGASSAWFVANVGVGEDIELTVIDPEGNEITKDSEKVSNLSLETEVKFIELDGPTSGRWIVRLRRKLTPNVEARQGTAFEIFAAARNPSIFLEAEVQVVDRTVKFTTRTVYDLPLDFVHSKVEVFDAIEPGNGSRPIRTATLQREEISRVGASAVEISSGRLSAELELPEGDYIALFSSANHGNAVHANNPNQHPIGFAEPLEQPQIPNFSRQAREPFSVR